MGVKGDRTMVQIEESPEVRVDLIGESLCHLHSKE
jgi:hypothetical protein